MVKLIKLNNDYIGYNLYLGCVGIVLSENKDFADVLFINQNIVGDYAIVSVKKTDVEEQFIEIPQNFLNKLDIKDKLSDKSFTNKQMFKTKTFNEGDCVKLIADNENYKKHNIFKGDTGIVAADYLVKNKVLVDFSRVDNNGFASGDCIAVDLKDLEKIN